MLLTSWFTMGCLLIVQEQAAAPRGPLDGVRRVVFLGDSITYAGQYIDDVEAVLRTRHPALACEFLNLGLPSETVSGLSEPGHAGGEFPRPLLRERLDRVLEQTRPDLVVACYGMNDGIYHPFSESRLKAFQDGILELREHAARTGARVLHLTPPVFDPAPIKPHTLPAGLPEYRQPFEGYDEVLDRYSEWLLDQKSRGWDVVDVHGPLKRHLAAARGANPTFRLADDGVHLNDAGHWLIAREVLRHWGELGLELAPNSDRLLAALPRGVEVRTLVAERQAILRDSWLTATGHKRPGIGRGAPIAEAERRAGEIGDKIRKLLKPAP